jgi:hypothetical protein
MFNFKSVVLVALLVVSTAQAAEEYAKRVVAVYCNDTQQVLDKIGGVVELSWIDQDENIWVSFRDTKGALALTITPKDNRKQMCIVSYGKDLADKRKYL